MPSKYSFWTSTTMRARRLAGHGGISWWSGFGVGDLHASSPAAAIVSGTDAAFRWIQDKRMKIAIHAFDGISLFHLAVPTTRLLGGTAARPRPLRWETVGVEHARPRVSTAEGVTRRRPPRARTPPSRPTSSSSRPGTQTCGLPIADVAAAITRGRSSRRPAGGPVPGRLPARRLGPARRTDRRHALGRRRRAVGDRHPSVLVNADAIYVDHGDVLTSAGTASSLDACLHIVRRELGSEAAATLARHLVVAPHRDGGQAQYISRPMPEPGGVGQLGRHDRVGRWPTSTSRSLWTTMAAHARHEHAQLHPPLHRGHRLEPGAVADEPAPRRVAATARAHRRCRSTRSPRAAASAAS